MTKRSWALWAAAFGAAASLASPATASSPAAWASFQEELVSACRKASQLRAPAPAGNRVDYDDALGWTALVLKGRYPQPHMKNRPGRELCLFDRKTRTAHVTEADRLTSPRP